MQLAVVDTSRPAALQCSRQYAASAVSLHCCTITTASVVLGNVEYLGIARALYSCCWQVCCHVGQQTLHTLLNICYDNLLKPRQEDTYQIQTLHRLSLGGMLESAAKAAVVCAYLTEASKVRSNNTRQSRYTGS